MEFDEIRKIWDSQNNKPLYGFDEETLHNRVRSKKKRASHITNISELLLIIVNGGSGCFILGMNFQGQSGNLFMYLLSAWAFITAVYLVVSRIRRIKGNSKFDRSLRGDLSYAISVASYQVRLSQLGRWNIVPIAILVLLSLWDSGKPMWINVSVLVFFVLVYYATNWEHTIYKVRKRELETLQNKLEKDELGERSS